MKNRQWSPELAVTMLWTTTDAKLVHFNPSILLNCLLSLCNTSIFIYLCISNMYLIIGVCNTKIAPFILSINFDTSVFVVVVYSSNTVF